MSTEYEDRNDVLVISEESSRVVGLDLSNCCWMIVSRSAIDYLARLIYKMAYYRAYVEWVTFSVAQE